MDTPPNDEDPHMPEVAWGDQAPNITVPHDPLDQIPWDVLSAQLIAATPDIDQFIQPEVRITELDSEWAQEDDESRALRLDCQQVAERHAREQPLMVDSRDKVKSLLNILEPCTGHPPRVVVDTEGFNDYRLQCDIIEIYHIPSNQLYLVDIHDMTRLAFDFETSSRFTLRKFLTDRRYLKLFWDCRADANALFTSYDITLDGVVDLSIMVTELAWRQNMMNHHRLRIQDAIERHLYHTGLITEGEYTALDDSKRHKSGLIEEWAHRPLDGLSIAYTRDVRLMGIMYDQALKPLIPLDTRWLRILVLSCLDARRASTPLFDLYLIRDSDSPFSPNYYENGYAHPAYRLRANRIIREYYERIIERRRNGHTTQYNRLVVQSPVTVFIEGPD